MQEIDYSRYSQVKEEEEKWLQTNRKRELHLLEPCHEEAEVWIIIKHVLLTRPGRSVHRSGSVRLLWISVIRIEA